MGTISTSYSRYSELSKAFKSKFDMPILAFDGRESKLHTDKVTRAFAFDGTVYNCFFRLLVDVIEFNKPDLTGLTDSSRVSP